MSDQPDTERAGAATDGGDTCPGEEVVLGFLEQRLPDGERAQLEIHTDRCESCRRLLAELARGLDPEGVADLPTAEVRRARGRDGAGQGAARRPADLDSAGPTLPAVAWPVDGDASSLPVRDPGRYVRLGELARGGMGRIVSVRDRELGRDLAIKEMLGTDAGLMQRFEREVRITARLQHPAIIAVHEAGRWPSGEPFFTMKRVEGRSLHRVIRERSTLAARLELLPNIIAVADALAYAHDHGVIHRDLKPANVLVGDFGETVLIDWGLAKVVGHRDGPASAGGGGGGGGGADVPDSGEGLTLVGEAMGTPAYMPPEQALGEPVDARADVYALGALLYHVIAGAMPFLDERPRNGAALLALVGERGPTELAALAPDAPRELVAIVDKAMARAPADRYADAGELAGDLKRFQQGQMVSAHDYSGLALLRRWVARHRTLVASVTAVVLFGLVAGGFAFTREQRLRREAQRQRDRATLAQGQAEVEQQRAERQTRALLEQQGRTELDALHPRRAAVLLVEVLRGGADSLVVRALVSEALRNLAVLRPVRTLPASSRNLVTVAVSPDGRSIATAGAEPVIRLWDAASGRLIRTLEGHPQAVSDVEFSPDGTRLASASLDGSVRLWNVAGGEAERVLTGHLGRAYDVAFSRDGASLATGGADYTVRVWDVATGAPRAVYRDLTSDATDVVFGPGGEVIVGSGLSLVSFDPRTGRRLDLVKSGALTKSMAMAPDGKTLYVGDDDGAASLWRVEGGRLARRLLLEEHAGAASTIAVSPDGDLFATGDRDGIIRLWDARAGARIAAADIGPGAVRQLAFTPDGRGLASVGTSGHAALWSLDLTRAPRSIASASHPASAAYTRDGARFLVGTRDGMIDIHDAASLTRLGGFPVGMLVFDARWSPDGTRLVTTGWGKPGARAESEPRLWDAASGALIAVLHGHTDQVYRLGYSPDGALIATASWDGSVRLWDGRTGDERGVLHRASGARYFGVAFHPDGTRVAASAEGKLRVFDVASRQVVNEIDAHEAAIGAIAYSHDGSRLATAGRDDYLVRVWDGASLAPVCEMRGHMGRIMTVDFTPDGRRVATAAFDRTTRLWDASSGELLRSIESQAHLAVISPDGRRLLANAPHDDSILEWDISLDQRAPDAVADDVAGLSPWRLVDGRLVIPATGPGAAAGAGAP